MRHVYALYYDAQAGQTQGQERLGFKGIFRKEESNDVAVSSVPKGMLPLGYLYFNKDGYSTYCKEYKEYWEWVSTRNDERYANTLQHGKNYDAKNMMHTIRLLEMASEIAQQGKVIVRRPNRDFLLQIRRGDFSYEELVSMAEDKTKKMEQVYKQALLPNQPDYAAVNALLVELRKKWYEERGGKT
jgi:tRNA U34 5-carboxymethylaminomethyl modifying enzyme MnmG/GidA